MVKLAPYVNVNPIQSSTMTAAARSREVGNESRSFTFTITELAQERSEEHTSELQSQ